MFGVKKFHQYLFAKEFILLSDSKPLVSIFGSKKGIPPLSANRLQRYALFLSGYQFQPEYVNTKRNIADYFSRVAMDPPEEDASADDVYVNYVQEVGNLPIKFSDVVAETSSK